MENQEGVRVIRKKQPPKPNDGPMPELGSVRRRAPKKFVNLYSGEGKDRETVLLTGRHPCTCLASKHNLINNCISCGRIICEQEGSGACFTCGELVASPREMEMLSKNSRKANQLRQKLEEQDAALAAAVAHKDRLIDFDRSCAKRTQVIDDDRDYWSSENKWLTQKERKQVKVLEEKNRDAKSRLNQKTTIDLDFAGRKVVERVEAPPELYMPETLKAIENAEDDLPSYVSDRRLAEIEFVETDVKLTPKNKASHKMQLDKIQDDHLKEISDEGICLSMQQPYASLLIAGIKKHEGRSWFHPHRGRLWIHAAAKKPTQSEIDQLLNSYRLISTEMHKAPKNYPTGVLLGCIDVTDCLGQTKYRQQYPNGENSSPYVFICENPCPLKTNFPMKGGPKMFKLDTKLLNAARKQIMFTQN